MDNQQYGVIHEVGDMGLGFNVLPDEKDQKTLNDHDKDQKEKNSSSQNRK